MFGLRASIPWSIGITYGILSPSIVIVCEVMSVIGTGLSAFGRSFDCGSSGIPSAAIFSVRGRSRYT